MLEFLTFFLLFSLLHCTSMSLDYYLTANFMLACMQNKWTFYILTLTPDFFLNCLVSSATSPKMHQLKKCRKLFDADFSFIIMSDLL